MTQADHTTDHNFLAAPVLIVDDCQLSAMYIERALQKRGMTRLHVVTSAEEAMNCLPDFQPELVIMDLMMPGMDGFECISAIRNIPHFHDMAVLVQTGLTEPEMRKKAFEIGATDFVTKPIYADELYARVKVHLQNRLYVKGLIHYKQRISDELKSAQQLQCSILPTDDELTEMRKNRGIDIAAWFKPSSEIGGDFWGIRPLGDDATALWMVDFSGHGVAAALNAFRIHSHMKEPAEHEEDPGAYLTRLNRTLMRLLMRGQFATAFYGVLDRRTQQLRYACAGCPHPLLYDAGSGRAKLLDGSGMPLGIVSQQYRTNHIPFTQDDMLVLYSDAFIETPVRAAQGQSLQGLDETQLLPVVEDWHDHDSATIRNAILAYFNQHIIRALEDDLTLFVCKRLAA